MNYELACDDKSITLDYSEGEAFQVLLPIARSQSDSTTELLQTVPILKEKIERVGGLRAILDRGQLRIKSWSAYTAGPVLYQGNTELNAELDALCNHFRWNPAEVHQSLEALQSAESFELLSRAAAAPCTEMADVAASFARKMTLNESTAENRISTALRLIPSYSFDGRRLAPQWIQFGLDVLRQAGPRTTQSRRSELEDGLVGELSLVDFRSAMSYIDAAEQPLARLQMLLAAMQALDREAMRAKR